MKSRILPSISTNRIAQYWVLTKPRVTHLAVFCAVIGMFLSTRGMVPWQAFIGGTIGIWLLAGSAFAVNCLLDHRVDALMRRTAQRPSARGEITPTEIIAFSTLLGTTGALLLYAFTNSLTMWLTLATFVGYAIIYTVFLKPSTPQNIVIGGAAGAMPPALGWSAITGTVPADAWILVLIIFVWTPPHFWALALYRYQDYIDSGLPMLPITHGKRYTRLQILLYSIVLFLVSLMPFLHRMSGYVYLVSAILLSSVFLGYAWKLWRNYSDALSRSMFRYSIVYLSLLFAALLIDHYLEIFLFD
ncbi:heme o synthase [Candidatus Pandoraea novymonadis]|uniref:Protoheme IX farnesyltransferase n=1 Tax=Candidatus Pandoraea novymonadis TaxID=1808959 RepID=A0ABX5FE68_9BURK|nr:heme o synthase [Candidatus Pandoraea novymonadis]PSB91753.1 Protoheme IX farnesyltransferase [Candidatus Pandoraea novymonadis]